MAKRNAKPPGYSGTPLAQKLGIKPDMHWVVLGAPETYATWLEGLPPNVRIETKLTKPLAAVHLFVTERRRLETLLVKLRQALATDGFVWVSWPKKAAQVATDITEDVIREVALPLGWVDVKVCAVSDVWSGLKLVIRRELRGG